MQAYAVYQPLGFCQLSKISRVYTNICTTSNEVNFVCHKSGKDSKHVDKNGFFQAQNTSKLVFAPGSFPDSDGKITKLPKHPTQLGRRAPLIIPFSLDVCYGASCSVHLPP